MKLLTHNILTSNVKGIKNGYPLLITATETVVNEVDFNPAFIAKMLPRIEWGVLVAAASQVGQGGDLPSEVPENAADDQDFLQKAHHALLEVEVKEGFLECPESHKKYVIANGVPNMLLSDDQDSE